MRRFAQGLIGLILAFVIALPSVGYSQPTRADYLTLVRSGWVFDLHSARMRRDPTLPPVRFDSVEVAKGEICLFGETPHALSRDVMASFTALLREVYDRQLDVTFAGENIANCPARQRVYIRLYSDLPPSRAFNADLRQLDQDFDIRFPPNWLELIKSPAQTNGFFGHSGPVVHLLINQPPREDVTLIERDFYASILIEELFQAVSFGADILKFDHDTPFYSKLQERPANLRHMAWQSERFMTGLLASNPKGLCAFDVFMLHALAAANLENVNSEALLIYVDTHFDDLSDATMQTLDRPAYRILLDGRCLELPQ